MTGDPLTTIEDTVVIDVPVARVWRAMTEPDRIVRWLGCLQYEKAVGHVFYMQPDNARREAGDIEGATHCEILVLDELSEFRFSWYLPGTPKTEVAITLMAIGDSKTAATLTHSGWDQFEANEIRAVWEMLSGGWRSAVLPGLKYEAETR